MGLVFYSLLLPVIATSPLSFAVADEPPPVSFRERVAPILVKSCLGCHNDKKAENGLNMTTFTLLKKGGKASGSAVIVPGEPDESELVLSVRSDAEPRMPLKLPPISAEAIRTLEDWVKQGAKFDGADESNTPIASLVDPLRGLPNVSLTVKATEPVTFLAISPDETTLAASVGRQVLLFDLTTGKSLTTLDGHPGPLNVVRFTSDGKTLLAAGGRPGMFGAITVWDVATSRRLNETRGHSDTILAADFAPDGKTLATASFDRLVMLWDFESLKPIKTLKEHTDAVNALAFAPDGKTLATAGSDRTVKLWSVASGTRQKTLSDSTGELYTLAFTPDGTTLFAAGVDRSIRGWRVVEKDAPIVKSAFAHDGAVLRIGISSDGKTLVSSGEDRDVKLWDVTTFEPLRAFPKQSDWPQAIALSKDGKRLAIGRHDGSIEFNDAVTGKTILNLRGSVKSDSSIAQRKPELVRNPSLNPPSPRGGTRGDKVRITLGGNGVGLASQVMFGEPGLSATIIAAQKLDPNRLDIDLKIDKDARCGLHRIGVIGPTGVPPEQVFLVEPDPASNEVEPNEDPKQVKPVDLNLTFIGTIDKPGDVDHFRFPLKEDQRIRFVMTAKALGSGLTGVLSVLDDQGRTLASAEALEGGKDPTLGLVAPKDGTYTLRVADNDYGGSGNHFYRISASSRLSHALAFPMGISGDGSNSVFYVGDALDRVGVPAGTRTGTIVSLLNPTRPATSADEARVVVADGPQSIEVEPNGIPSEANLVAVPGGVSGRIERPLDLDRTRFEPRKTEPNDDVDHFKFKAKKGERLVVEIYGRRLGSSIDPVIEILDASGNPVPRALLRPVAQTEVAFRDHNASGTGIRLTTWNNMAINDVVLVGREVAKIFALPRNPDDDCQFWGENGQRIGFMETTPEHHPMGQPIYKVEIHPPGTILPPGGVPPVTLYYRNDDGGPRFDKDSYLTFDPPADGTYVVRVTDVRDLGGHDFGYHLVIRRPQPNFVVSVKPENPNIPRGGTVLVTVNIARIDGFEGLVNVVAKDLPPGITSTPVTVERGMMTASLSLSADPTAPTYSAPSWTIKAWSLTTNNQSLDPDIKTLDPGGVDGGRITVTPPPNLTIKATPERVVIRPGHEVTINLAVDRGPAFAGRIPIDVRNLPQGVRVLNIGLNGVLITENQTARTITLYAEPWVAKEVRPFYAVGKAESAGTDCSSAPITLVVESDESGH